MDSDEQLDFGDTPLQSLDIAANTAEDDQEKSQEHPQEEEKLDEVQSLNSYQPDPDVPTNPEIFSRPHIKKQPKIPKQVPEPSPLPVGIPVMTQDTTSRDTYDLDLLQDPKTQKKLEAGHRFLAPAPFPIERRRSLSPQSGPDFILRNIANAREKSIVRANLELRDSSAGILMSSSSKDRKGPADLKRFEDFRTQAEIRLEKLTEVVRKKETAECSFRPAIFPGAAEMPNRSAGVYYQYMLDHQQRVEEKVSSLKSENEIAFQQEVTGYFHPSLCPESRKMDPPSDEPRFERLYKMHKEKLQHQLPGDDILIITESSTSADSLFHPIINEQSQRLRRPLPVEEHLYQEAQSRAQRHKANAWVPKPQEKLISSGSEALLISKFHKELSEKWTSLEPEGQDISYLKFVKLLTEMWFIENTPGSKSYEQERLLIAKAWAECGGANDRRVGMKEIEEFLMLISNFPEASPQVSSQSEGEPESGKRVTSPERSSRLRVMYRPLYEHRMEVINKSPLKPSFRANYEYSFQPRINEERTRERDSRKVVDYLWEDVERRKERREKLKNKVEAATLKECVFTPTTNVHPERYIGKVEKYAHDPLSKEYVKLRQEEAHAQGTALYKLAAVAQERKKQVEKKPEDYDTEKNMVNCTFVPDLSLTREVNVKALSSGNETWGVDKAVDRLKKGREDAERFKIMTERGWTHKEDLPTFYFTVNHPHKLGEVFDASKAPLKKVGKPGRHHITIRSKIVLTPSPKPEQITEVSQPQEDTPQPVLEEKKDLMEPLLEQVLELPVSLEQVQSKSPSVGLVPSKSPSVESASEKTPSSHGTPSKSSPVPTDAPVTADIPPTTAEVQAPPVADGSLTIDVSVSETSKEPLVYRPGDNVEELVQRFIETHSLPSTMIEQLKEMIAGRIQQGTQP